VRMFWVIVWMQLGRSRPSIPKLLSTIRPLGLSLHFTSSDRHTGSPRWPRRQCYRSCCCLSPRSEPGPNQVQETQPQYESWISQGPQQYENYSGFADFADSDDVLSELLRRSAHVRARGADARYHLPIEFLEAVTGATKRLTLPDGKTLDVTIPAGIQNGQVLRLRGKGRPGIGDGEPGDALVEIAIKPHPFFVREGNDVYLDLPVTLSEAVLGAHITVPTPTGAVTMTVPKGSNTGTVLRLRGKGVLRRDGNHGDELVRLKVMLPERSDPELEAFATNWE